VAAVCAITLLRPQVECFAPRFPDSKLNFSATIRQAGEITLLDISGRLTSFEADALRDSIGRLLKQGRKNILLNLNGLQYLDSSGVGELVREYVTVVKHGGQMKVVGLTPKVEEILKVTQLYQVFPDFPSEEAALESFPESRGKS
jgi:anti-sigma B factor antagonist